LLVKANAELDRFVYSTSHDLRAPLSSVMGLINISDSVQDPIVLKRYLGMMKDRMLSLDKFIKDITDYSRNNRKEIGREKFILKDLALEVWEELRYAPEATHIKFEVTFSDHAEVHSDKSRLKVILSNLISNAIRYHDQRKISPFIRLHFMPREQGFHLKVEDNGQGIPPEYHHKIFDMFYRANESSTGSGLGLYIVKETLDRLSGSVLVESRPGTGSSFTILLPE
jgi:signal transduction histidine kinase